MNSIVAEFTEAVLDPLGRMVYRIKSLLPAYLLVVIMNHGPKLAVVLQSRVTKSMSHKKQIINREYPKK